MASCMPAPGAAPVAEPLIAEPTCGSVPLEIWMVSLAAPVRLAALLERLSAPLIAESASVPTAGGDADLEIRMVSLAAPVRLAALLGCEASRGDAERRVETIQARGAIDFFQKPRK